MDRGAARLEGGNCWSGAGKRVIGTWQTLHMCCRVVVAQLSERRQLRLEAFGSIPSGYPCLQFVSILIYCQLLTTSSYYQLLLISIVTKVIM